MGNLNNVSQNTNTLINGKSNVVSRTHQTTVLGEGNNQIQFSTNSLINGKNNKEKDINNPKILFLSNASRQIENNIKYIRKVSKNSGEKKLIELLSSRK